MRVVARLCALIFVVGSASGQVRNEFQKLVPSDGDVDGRFGDAIDIYNDRILIGAPQDDDNGVSSGACFLFDAGTGVELMKLVATDGSVGDQFGSALDVHGSLAVVGAPYDDDSGVDSGAAYLFNIETGAQMAKLIPSQGVAGDLLGASVALANNRVFVGAPGRDEAYADSGAIYVFSALTGFEHSIVLHPTPSVGGRFGEVILAEGSLLVVGCPRDNYSGNDSGAVWFFDASTGGLIGFWLAIDGKGGDELGSSVAISGSLAIAGAPGADTAGSASGAAYLFDWATGAQLKKFSHCDASSADRLGASVALGAGVAIVGLPQSDSLGSNSGSARIFDTSTGQDVIELLPSDGAAQDGFGSVLSIEGRLAVVTSPLDDDAGAGSGSAYLFSTGVVPNSGEPFCFGDGSGSACPCAANGAPGEGCLNTTGLTGAALTGLGNAARTNDTFHLAVDGAPGASVGVIYRGINQHVAGLGAPVGDGLLCVSGQTARSQVQQAVNGSTVFYDFRGLPFSFSSYGICMPAHYQYWYRDSSNTCSGLGFNFSNAWTVVWKP